MKKLTARIAFVLSLLALSPALPAASVSLARAAQTEWLCTHEAEEKVPSEIRQTIHATLPLYGIASFTVAPFLKQWIKKTPRSRPFLAHHQRTPFSDESEG